MGILRTHNVASSELAWYAQLVEHCTGVAEVMGSNPVQAGEFFRALISQLLKLCAYCCDDQAYLNIILRHSVMWIFIYSLVFFTFYRYTTNSQPGQLPVSLTAQLVEHCTNVQWKFSVRNISRQSFRVEYYFLSTLCECDSNFPKAKRFSRQ